MLTSEVRKHSNELWRMGRVVLSVTGDVTVLKIIKSMRQAHYDIDKTRWHAQQIRPPFSILHGPKWKHVCPPLFFNVQIKMSNPSHYRPAGNHSKWNSAHTLSEWTPVGACMSSRDSQTHLWQTFRRGNWSVCQPRQCIFTCAQITTSIHDQKGPLLMWTGKNVFLT